MSALDGGISDEEKQRRLNSVRAAIHSARLEGGQISAEVQRDMQEYVEGRITIEEGLDRLRQRTARRIENRRAAQRHDGEGAAQ